MKKFGNVNMACYFKLPKLYYPRVSKNRSGWNKQNGWKLSLCLFKQGGGSFIQNKKNRVGGDPYFAYSFRKSIKASLKTIF